MAATTTVILPDGRSAEAVEVPVESANEKWSEFTLQDGTVLKVKVNLVNIVRVDGEYDPAGGPVYQLNAAPTVVFANVPEHLKRPKSS